MYSQTKYIKTIVEVQNHKGQTVCGNVLKEELKDNYLTLAKAKTFGIHTSIYHIVNANDMQAQGSYLFEWLKD